MSDRLPNIKESRTGNRGRELVEQLLLDHSIPEAVDSLSVQQAFALLAALAALELRVAARLAHDQYMDHTSTAQTDRMLTADEVAACTGLSTDYVYRKASKFPFTRRFGRALRFSEKGLNQ